jgi:hypothetical protein
VFHLLVTFKGCPDGAGSIPTSRIYVDAELDFSRVVSQNELRDGINPLFEPLSFATIADAIKVQIENGSIVLNGNQLYLE